MLTSIDRMLTTGSICLVGALAAPVHAAQATYQFNLPEQSLAEALRAIGRQTTMTILFEPKAVENITAPALRAQLTASEAIDRLLAGTRLGAQQTSENTVLIQSRVQTEVSRILADGESLRLAQAEQAPGADLDEVVVTSTVVLTQNDAFGATKMGMSIKDTPQTTVVATRDLIEIARLRTFDDFYKVDASTGSSHARIVDTNQYYRGFWQQGSNSIRIDGFRMPINLNIDFAAFDRIELVKGATSALYGQSSIGGTLNAVSKLPQTTPAGELRVQGGEFSYHRADADFTGSIGGSDAWSYRVIGAYEDSDTFQDIAHQKLKFVSSALQYQPDDDTTLRLRLTYQDKNDVGDWADALQFVGNSTATPFERLLAGEKLKIADIPRSRFYGLPSNGFGTEALFVQFQGEHQFADNWTLRAHLQHSDIDNKQDQLIFVGPIDQFGFPWVAYHNGRTTDGKLDGAELNLFGDVQLFGRDHTVFFGVDYNRSRSKELYGEDPGALGADTQFNIFNPDYDAISEVFPARAEITDFVGAIYDTFDERDLFGATVQLVLNPTDRLSVMLGGRYSADELVNGARAGTADTVFDLPFITFADEKFEEVVFQSGITYRLTPAVNLYANYGQTFEPQFSRVFVAGDPDGELMDPEEGTNYEVGLKADLTRDLFFTAAVFQMERTNISQADPTNPPFSAPLGTQRSRGVELGAQGRITPALSLFGSLAWLDAEFIEGEFKGGQPANAPKFGLSAFGTYELLHGAAKGLGFGLGVVHKSGIGTFDSFLTQLAGTPYSFDFGDFTEIDARVFYGRDRWNFALSATNLLDEEYYSPIRTLLRAGVHVNPPRNIRASVSYKF
jgi:iron complex outermembrane receptor protein